MKISFCLGSATVLKQTQIDILRNSGPVYSGDTAIGKFYVDNLVAVTDASVQAVISTHTICNVYVLPEQMELMDKLYIQPVPPLPYKGKRKFDKLHAWTSNTMAVLIASLQDSDVVFLIGFENMQSAEVYQIAKLFELFPKTNYILIQDTDDYPPSLDPYKNFNVDDVGAVMEYAKNNLI